MNKRFLLIILFLLPLFSLFPQGHSKTVVTIEQAMETHYSKNEHTGADIIELKGEVIMSVTQDTTKTTIYADFVRFERGNNMLYAEGNVVLERNSGDQNETLTAESLLFNTDTQEGVFDKGRVVQEQSSTLNLPSGSTLVVASDMFAKDDTGTITFKDGVITFCEEEVPHWKISASRIWLLPGNEFAFFNALLYVGNLPIFYFPIFYYPKDEMICNPVFGYRTREGYYLQTSSYLVGRKPLDTETSEEDSFFDFMKSTQLKKQVREGLFFRNLEENAEEDSHYLKLMADYYTNLGGMVGLEGSFYPEKVISNLEFVLGLGFSRTLRANANYIPYDDNGNLMWDSSSLFGLKLPFRYYLNFQTSIHTDIFSGNISLPFYSDTYFSTDFMDRSETMDWIGFFTESGTDNENDSTVTEITSYSWQFSGSLKPNFKIFKPYINTLQISSFSSSFLFNSKQNEDFRSSPIQYYYSPQRKFYYPSQLTPLKGNITIAGTLVSFPQTTKNNSSQQKVSVDLIPPEDFVLDENSKSEETPDDIYANALLPQVTFTPPSVATNQGVKYTLSYTINPTYSSLLVFNGDQMNSPAEISLKKLQSTYYTFSSPVALNSVLSVPLIGLSLNNSFRFNPVVQKHPYLDIQSETNHNGYYSENQAEQILKNDYSAQKLDVQANNSLSFRPFAKIPFLANTSLSWNSTVKLLRTVFDGDINNPTWTYESIDWENLGEDNESISAHNLTFNFNSKVDAYSQTLTLQASLPPQVDSYLGKIQLVFPFMTFVAQTTIKQTSLTDETWFFEPFTQSSSWSLFNKKVTLTQSFSYNIEDKQSTSLGGSFSVYGLRIVYSMQHTMSYYLNTEEKKYEEEEKKFIPYSLGISYSLPSKTFKFFNDKMQITPGLSTSLIADLVKPTNSYFTFSPNIKFRINDFMDFTFSSTSRNNVVYKYFAPEVYGSSVETNFFKDLCDSFAFGNRLLREKSGFKIKSLKFLLTHDLHDWELNTELSITPRLVTNEKTNKKEMDYSPYFSFSVVWRPMSSLKTTIVDEYGTIQLNP